MQFPPPVLSRFRPGLVGGQHLPRLDRRAGRTQTTRFELRYRASRCDRPKQPRMSLRVGGMDRRNIGSACFGASDRSVQRVSRSGRQAASSPAGPAVHHPVKAVLDVQTARVMSGAANNQGDGALALSLARARVDGSVRRLTPAAYCSRRRTPRRGHPNRVGAKPVSGARSLASSAKSAKLSAASHGAQRAGGEDVGGAARASPRGPRHGPRGATVVRAWRRARRANPLGRPIRAARPVAKPDCDPALGPLQPDSGCGRSSEPLMGHGQNQPVQGVILPFGITVD